MRICSLVENTSNCGMRTAHGLSLYIETRNHHVLFDVGQDETIFENARKMNVQLEPWENFWKSIKLQEFISKEKHSNLILVRDLRDLSISVWNLNSWTIHRFSCWMVIIRLIRN